MKKKERQKKKAAAAAAAEEEFHATSPVLREQEAAQRLEESLSVVDRRHRALETIRRGPQQGCEPVEMWVMDQLAQLLFCDNTQGPRLRADFKRVFGAEWLLSVHAIIDECTESTLSDELRLLAVLAMWPAELMEAKICIISDLADGCGVGWDG